MLSIKLTQANLLLEYWVRIKRQLGVSIFYMNPMFNDDYNFGEFTNSITFSEKDVNNGVLAGTNREYGDLGVIFYSWDSYNFRAELFKDGCKLLEGKLTFNELTENEYNASIASGLARFTFINKKLSELFTWQISFESSDTLPEYAAFANSLPYPVCVFPQIRNKNFYGQSDRMPLWSYYCNRYLPSGNFFRNEVSANFVVTGLGLNYAITSQNKDNLVPQFVLKQVLAQIFNPNGYAIGGEFWDDPDTEGILLENRFALDNFKLPYGYFAMYRTAAATFSGTTIFNATWLTKVIDVNNYQTSTTPFRIRIKKAGIHKIRAKWLLGAFDPNAYYAEVLVDGNLVYRKSWDPMDATTWFVSFDFEAFNFNINQEIVFQLRSAGNYELLGNTDYNNPDTYLRIDQPFGQLNGHNDYTNKIEGSKCVPDVTLSELLSCMKKTFGLNIYPSGNTVIFERIKDRIEDSYENNYTEIADRKYTKKMDGDIFDYLSYEWPEDELLREYIRKDETDVNASVDSFTALPAATDNQLAWVENERAVYRTELTAGVWKWVFDHFEYKDISINMYTPAANPEPKIRYLGAPPVMMTSMNWGPWNKALMPWTEMKGSAPGELGSNNANLIRFLHWHGMRENAGGDLYPQASSNGRDTAGTVINPYGLYWEELIDNFWGNWLRIINKGFTWTRKLYMNMSQLNLFNPVKVFRIQNRDCFTKQCTINIESEKKIAEVEIEYYDNLT